VPFDRGEFAAWILSADPALEPAEQNSIATALIDAGCRFAVSSGYNASSWDGAVDYAYLLRHPGPEVDPANFVMTSWHENESLDEVAEFFVRNTSFETFSPKLFVVVGVGVDAPLQNAYVLVCELVGAWNPTAGAFANKPRSGSMIGDDFPCRIAAPGKIQMLIVRGTAILAAVVLGLIASCDFSQGRDEASAVAEKYFASMRGGDITGALSLYSERFYKATSRKTWLEFLNGVRARCGAPKSHSLKTWNVTKLFGTDRGTRATLQYDVQYSTCKMSEKMTIFIPDGGDGKIEGHLVTQESLGRKEPTATTI
jgi:hypothetical protein